jgi:hypothetical protein
VQPALFTSARIASELHGKHAIYYVFTQMIIVYVAFVIFPRLLNPIGAIPCGCLCNLMNVFSSAYVFQHIQWDIHSAQS